MDDDDDERFIIRNIDDLRTKLTPYSQITAQALDPALQYMYDNDIGIINRPRILPMLGADGDVYFFGEDLFGEEKEIYIQNNLASNLIDDGYDVVLGILGIDFIFKIRNRQFARELLNRGNVYNPPKSLSTTAWLKMSKPEMGAYRKAVYEGTAPQIKGVNMGRPYSPPLAKKYHPIGTRHTYMRRPNLSDTKARWRSTIGKGKGKKTKRNKRINK